MGRRSQEVCDEADSRGEGGRNTQAVAVLKEMEAHRDESSPYVFHSPTDLGYVHDLRVTWEKAKKPGYSRGGEQRVARIRFGSSPGLISRHFVRDHKVLGY